VFILINALNRGWSHRRRAQIINHHFGVTNELTDVATLATLVAQLL